MSKVSVPSSGVGKDNRKKVATGQKSGGLKNRHQIEVFSRVTEDRNLKGREEQGRAIAGI